MVTRCIIFLLLSICYTAYGQGIKKNTLSVPRYKETDIGELLTNVQKTNVDTEKVWLLYKIAAIYWMRKSPQFDLDSCIYYAQIAKQLSQRISYTEGFEEASFLLCKSYVEQGRLEEAQNQLKGVKGDQRIRLLLVIAEYYTFLPGQLKENLDKGYPFIQQALHESEILPSPHWQEESQILLGKYYFAVGDIDKGKSYFMMVINHYQKESKKAEEARWWSDLAIYLPASLKTLPDRVVYFDKAIDLYREIQDKPNQAYTLSDKANTLGSYYQLNEAIASSSKALQLLTEAGIKKKFNVYFSLATFYNLKGDLKRAQSYAIASLNNMDSLKDESRKGLLFLMMGDIYTNLGQFQVGTQYYEKGFPMIGRYGTKKLYNLALDYTSGLLNQGQYNKVKLFLQKIEKESPPVEIGDKETMLAAWGNYYYAIKNYLLAEKYYLKMIDADNIAKKERFTLSSFSVVGIKAYSFITQFYIDQKRFKEAEPFLKKFKSFENSSGLYQNQISLLQAKADSAAGNYQLAFKNFELHRKINDSIFNAANLKQLADMRIKYETSEKEKDIILLQKESQLQQRRIDQSRQLRNFILLGIVMLFIILGIGYNRYRLKQSSYQLLEQKQNEINAQNTSLNTLNVKQQKLLEEKEWLVKEIHHRVKNNLQLMQSLLKSQQYFLEDESASLAISTSERRLHAMSLVHQKLYMTDQVNKIDMHSYIFELLDYLKESFGNNNKVKFHVKVDPLYLDVVQAVPLGLFINEVVTNAIKYAFPNDQAGVIFIRLSRTGDDITLQINDNGVGLPEDIDPDNMASFGMKLIQGLSQQLDGQLFVRNDNGLETKVVFKDFGINRPELT